MAGQLNALPQDVFEVASDDGARFKIRRGGKPGGVRLFVSNGNGFAADGYRVFWEPLLADFDLILFDMRNHGRNEPVGADRHTYFQMARDLGAIFHDVTKRLGKARSVGIFHSMSARAAMKHAVQMEWVWDALVLFDPPNVPPRGHPHYEPMRNFELKLSQWAAGRQDVFSSPSELRDFWATSRTQSKWHSAAREDMANAVLRADGRGAYELRCRREYESTIYLAALTLDLWPSASEFAGPVKLIGADPDDRGGPPIGPANRALATEGKYEYEAIPGSGHMLQLEYPEACRDALISFLRKLSLA